jgi:hypothetical protein
MRILKVQVKPFRQLPFRLCLALINLSLQKWRQVRFIPPKKKNSRVSSLAKLPASKFAAPQNKLTLSEGESCMRRGIGATLVLASIATVGMIVFYAANLTFWLSPPAEKFKMAWAEDIKLLERSGKLPKEWKQIKDIQVSADNSPAQEWLPDIKPPIAMSQDGHYRLDVFLVHWIEGKRYGAIVQYNLIDTSTNNTEWELGRTLKLGLVY